MTDLRDDLRRLRPPDAEDAQERGWEVARAAFDDRRPHRRRPRRAIALAAIAAGASLTALSPAGAALADWVRDAVRDEAAPRPALRDLPADASVLALAGADLWLVHPDGSRRRLGTYEDATFSPQARFVAATRGARLTALDPRGRVRWALDRSRPVTDPRWAPSGLRVAYRAGQGLRVVYGDGNVDRLLAGRVAPVAPAWRPGATHVVAWAGPQGRIEVADTDSGRRLWRGRAGERPLNLVWSPDGRELLVVRRSSIARLDAAGRVLAVAELRGAGAGAAWLPDGRSFVTVAARGNRSTVQRHESGDATVLFSGPGRVRGLAVSPDGRWLLLGWSGADQWLFVRTDGRGRPRVAASIARDFTPDAGALAPFPRPLGWR